MKFETTKGEDGSIVVKTNGTDGFTFKVHEVSATDGIKFISGADEDGAIAVKEIHFAKDWTSDKVETWLEKNVDKVSEKLYSINDVEIFSVGKWNGHEITQDDLTDMVKCFHATGSSCKPFLKLGHSDKQKLLQNDGLPAAGWVSDLRVAGSKLVADFVDIPKKVYALIKAKAYKAVSSEVFNNVEIAGEKYRKMLSGVALLGAEMPAVMDLKGILSLYSANTFTADIRPASIEITKSNFQTTPEKERSMPSDGIDQTELDKLKAQNDELTKAIALQKAELSDLKVSKFVSELKHEGVVTPAMEPFVVALLSDKENYSIDSKPYSKAEAIKELLSGAKELAKLNFSAKTETGNKDKNTDDEKALHAKIEKYAAEHKMSFTEAYKKTSGGANI